VDPELDPDADATGRDKIHAQLIDTWKSTHEARAHDEIADARAYARWLNDTARAEAEVELILALTRNLAEARAQGLPIDALLTDRLMEYMTGERASGGSGQQLPLWVVNGLLGRGEQPPPKVDLLPGK
jgi:hypothetical protein